MHKVADEIERHSSLLHIAENDCVELKNPVLQKVVLRRHTMQQDFFINVSGKIGNSCCYP